MTSCKSLTLLILRRAKSLLVLMIVILLLCVVILAWPSNQIHIIPVEDLVQRQDVVPKIIHQTYKEDMVPAKWKVTYNTVRQHHPDWVYMFWTDASIRRFIEEKYSWFLPTFDSYPHPIQRVDAFRYFALYHYGGIYIDLDIGAFKSLDVLLKYPVVLPLTDPVGFSNDFMVSQKGHPYFKNLIEYLPTFNHNWILPLLTVMFSTGPMFITSVYHLSSAAEVEGVMSMDQKLYSAAGPSRLVFHVAGSSWHSWDAPIVNAFWGTRFIWGPIVLVVSVLVVLFCVLKKRRRAMSMTTNNSTLYTVECT